MYEKQLEKNIPHASKSDNGNNASNNVLTITHAHR